MLNYYEVDSCRKLLEEGGGDEPPAKFSERGESYGAPGVKRPGAGEGVGQASRVRWLAGVEKDRPPKAHKVITELAD